MGMTTEGVQAPMVACMVRTSRNRSAAVARCNDVEGVDQ